jgi:hypothetical protein
MADRASRCKARAEGPRTAKILIVSYRGRNYVLLDPEAQRRAQPPQVALWPTTGQGVRLGLPDDQHDLASICAVIDRLPCGRYELDSDERETDEKRAHAVICRAADIALVADAPAPFPGYFEISRCSI